MAIRERAPKPQRQERKQTPDTTSIASHVAGAVDNLQRDRQSIQNPFELRRRADMAMVAMLEVVAPVLPDLVREQVNQLISIHDAFYTLVGGLVGRAIFLNCHRKQHTTRCYRNCY